MTFDILAYDGFTEAIQSVFAAAEMAARLPSARNLPTPSDYVLRRIAVLPTGTDFATETLL
jgi:hypothetical protein